MQDKTKTDTGNMNYFNDFIKFIDNRTKSLVYEESGIYEIISHLVQIMGEKEFNRKFEMYFIDIENGDTFNSNFFQFHKHMRQIDFFNDQYAKMDEDDPDWNKFSKGVQYKSIGGHLDMIFWNLIHVSDKPYECLKNFTAQVLREKYAERKDLEKILTKYFTVPE